jgi:WD40 repeat protein
VVLAPDAADRSWRCGQQPSPEPDGRILAAGSADGTVRLWNTADPADPRAVGPPLVAGIGNVASVAFSPDGSVLAAGGSTLLSSDNTLVPGGGGRVRLWNVGDPDDPRPLGPPLTGNDLQVLSVAFSPDGSVLATTGSGTGATTTIQLWDIADPAAPRPLGQPLAGPSTGVDLNFSLAFSPNGRLLASGGDSGLLQFWNVADPAHAKAIGDYISGTNIVASVRFTPDGRTLAAGNYDGTVQLWNVANPADPRETGKLDAGLGDASSPVDSVAFSPDGKQLASTYDNGTVGIWDVADPVHPSQIGQPLTTDTSYVFSAAFGPDGSTLVTGSNDETIRLWNLNIGHAINRICSVTDGDLTAQQWRTYIPQLSYNPPCPAR